MPEPRWTRMRDPVTGHKFDVPTRAVPAYEARGLTRARGRDVEYDGQRARRPIYSTRTPTPAASESTATATEPAMTGTEKEN